MTRIERKIMINAPIKRIWDVLDDHLNYAKWYITVNEVSKVGPKQQFFKTNVGDFTNIQQEGEPMKSMWSKQVDGPMSAIGFKFAPKGKAVEVLLWSESDIPDLEPVLGIAGDLMLKNAKTYIEYLEKGGDPKTFKKK